MKGKQQWIKMGIPQREDKKKEKKKRSVSEYTKYCKKNHKLK